MEAGPPEGGPIFSSGLGGDGMAFRTAHEGGDDQGDDRAKNEAKDETEYALRVVQFRQALYQAMADVENALSARTQLAAQGELLEQLLAAARQAEDMYEIRYRSGAVSLRFWLDAQEKRRTAEIERDQNTLDRLLNQVQLYQALGGDTR